MLPSRVQQYLPEPLTRKTPALHLLRFPCILQQSGIVKHENLKWLPCNCYEQIWENRFVSQVQSLCCKFWDGVSRMHEQTSNHHNYHDDEQHSKNRVHSSDNLVNRKHCGNQNVDKNNQCPNCHRGVCQISD